MMGSWPRIAGIAGNADDEVLGGGQHGLRLVAMRGMAARRQDEHSRVGCGAPDARDLLQRPEFIVFTLNREDGTADRCDQALDIPAAEFRVEPDLVPAPEG